MFFESITIRVGEEKNGIKVLGIEPPSNVRIEHMGGTYSVPVWTGTDWSKLGSPPVRGASNLIKDAPTALLALSPPEPAEVALAAEPAVEAEPAPPVVVVVASDPDEPDSDAPDAERQTTRAPSTEIPTPPAVRAAMPLPAYSEARAIAPAPTLGPSDQPPPPISASRIAVMTPAEVGAAISQVSRARRMPGLDQATQARLREEFVLLRTRQGTAP
ncbi:MAG: hypothetical protein EXS03_03010 [Phycisphaerales bacterium]|nr:hypothetical protein [Phycisphaerales bacterium]